MCFQQGNDSTGACKVLFRGNALDGKYRLDTIAMTRKVGSCMDSRVDSFLCILLRPSRLAPDTMVPLLIDQHIITGSMGDLSGITKPLSMGDLSLKCLFKG